MISFAMLDACSATSAATTIKIPAAPKMTATFFSVVHAAEFNSRKSFGLKPNPKAIPAMRKKIPIAPIQPTSLINSQNVFINASSSCRGGRLSR